MQCEPLNTVWGHLLNKIWYAGRLLSLHITALFALFSSIFFIPGTKTDTNGVDPKRSDDSVNIVVNKVHIYCPLLSRFIQCPNIFC